MSLSVELKLTGDVTTNQHQAAIKRIMDAVEKAANDLPGLPYPVIPYRSEIRTSVVGRPLNNVGYIDPEPFPEPTGYMHEAKMQFGFHLNPVATPAEPAACPDKQD